MSRTRRRRAKQHRRPVRWAWRDGSGDRLICVGVPSVAAPVHSVDDSDAVTPPALPVRLLGEFGAAHPCLLTVMMNAVDQYLTDAAAVAGSADLLRGAEVGSGEVPGFVVDGFGTGMAARRWREEFLRLGW